MFSPVRRAFVSRCVFLLVALLSVSWGSRIDAHDLNTPTQQGGGLLKTITFEHGQLAYPEDGADSVIGQVALETQAPLVGRYSVHFADPIGIGHLNEYIAPTDALFVSFLIQPVTTKDDSRIFLFKTADAQTTGNLVLTHDSQLILRLGNAIIGQPVPLPINRMSRVSVRQQRGEGTGALAAYVAAPDQSDGAPFAQTTTASIPVPITSVRIGGTDYHSVDFIADELTIKQLGADTSVQPPPLPPPPQTSGPLVTVQPSRIPLSAPELVNPMRGLYRWMGEEYAMLPQPALDAYDRYTWRDLEPSEGDYRFTKLEQDIAQAASQGRKYAFRVRALVSGHDSSVPDYLIQRMSRGWWTDYDHDGSRDTYVPDWNDPTFLERAQSLIAALGKRYDGDKRIAWVDIGLYGNWGEWHTASFSYPSPSGAERASSSTLHRIVDMHVVAFPTTQLVMLTDNADALAYAMSSSPRIGWRRDSLGWDTGHFEKIENDPVRWNAVKDRWKTAPVITEFANPRYQSDPTVYRKALEEVKRYHISLISNGNTLKWAGLSPEGKAAFVDLGKATGYRLALDQIQLPQTLAAGQPFALQTTWANDGVAPVYEPWQVVVQLRKPGTTSVMWEASSSLDLRSVLPGVSARHSDTFDLDDRLPSGVYTFAILVRDPRATRAPLQLASAGHATDGSYQFATVRSMSGGMSGGTVSDGVTHLFVVEPSSGTFSAYLSLVVRR